jgi:hypothetical protein
MGCQLPVAGCQKNLWQLGTGNWQLHLELATGLEPATC